MQRESRSNYIVRKMREDRMKNKPYPSEADMLTEENRLLKNNVRELQEQLQNAYIRIKELTESKQMELDI